MAMYWKIEGYDGTNLIYEKHVLQGRLPVRRIEDALKCLVARQGKLSEEEILGAYAKRRTIIANDLLEVRKNNSTRRLIYVCGTTPQIVAT